MLKNERHAIIMDLIRKQQTVKVVELKQLFNVSAETVRRDLSELEQQRLLRCVHGGAVYESPTTNEYRIDFRIKKNQLEKEAICKEAAKLVKDGESLAIIGTTTTLPLGTHLALKNDLTVVTNSIYLANQISENKSNKVILVGGRIWADEQKLMGQLTVQDFRQFRVDKAFISVAGVSPKDGLTEYNEYELEVTRAVMGIARDTILLCDSTKYSVVAFRWIANIKEISAIVTDWNVTKKEMSPYEEIGIRIYRAKPR